MNIVQASLSSIHMAVGKSERRDGSVTVINIGKYKFTIFDSGVPSRHTLFFSQ